MMRSMYAGVSGLKNHQTRMDVIGNNIANVNTVGYKKSRAVFKDTLYQTMRGASLPTDARGGTNPMGIGLGMTISSIDQIHTPAPATITNKLTDMSVDGNGYFVVENGGQKYYSRAGAFDFDRHGNLVNTSNGYRVHGWMGDDSGKIDTTAATKAVDISAYKSVEPKASTEMIFSGNLDSGVTINTPTLPAEFKPATDDPVGGEAIITSKDVFDSLGNKQTMYFRFFKAGDWADTNTDNEVDLEELSNVKWYCDVSLDPEFDHKPTIGVYPTDTNLADSTKNYDMIRISGITFTPDGQISAAGVQDIDLVLDRTVQGADNIEFNVDFSALTQFNSKSTAWAEEQDGYTTGDLTSFSVGIDGTIMGVYSNGETRNMARVALSNFQNPAGLLQAGSNLFQVSNNSGDPRIGAPGDQGMGAIIPGSLEMSNVDISEEFTDMIVTQRGFQANSRIITTSDEMLQELVNLKR